MTGGVNGKTYEFEVEGAKVQKQIEAQKNKAKVVLIHYGR